MPLRLALSAKRAPVAARYILAAEEQVADSWRRQPLSYYHDIVVTLLVLLLVCLRASDVAADTRDDAIERAIYAITPLRLRHERERQQADTWRVTL